MQLVKNRGIAWTLSIPAFSFTHCQTSGTTLIGRKCGSKYCGPAAQTYLNLPQPQRQTYLLSIKCNHLRRHNVTQFRNNNNPNSSSQNNPFAVTQNAKALPIDSARGFSNIRASSSGFELPLLSQR
jgi:hypothetical protein